MRKTFSGILFAVIMLITSFVPCYAASHTLLTEDIDDSDPSRGPKYVYRTTYGDTVQTEILALAANQDPEGTYFTREMRIHYSLSGGAVGTGTIQASFPPIYNLITISISATVGKRTSGTTGYSTGLAPDQAPGNYFLLITKYYYAHPYIVQRKRTGVPDIPSNWELDHTGATLTYRFHSARLIDYAEAQALGLK